MNATKAEWLEAIKRCMEQEEYGNKDSCELCKLAGYKDDEVFNITACVNCVCLDYAKHIGVSGGWRWHYCTQILIIKSVFTWQNIKFNRRILREMYTWLEGRKE